MEIIDNKKEKRECDLCGRFHQLKIQSNGSEYGEDLPANWGSIHIFSKGGCFIPIAKTMELCPNCLKQLDKFLRKQGGGKN